MHMIIYALILNPSSDVMKMKMMMLITMMVLIMMMMMMMMVMMVIMMLNEVRGKERLPNTQVTMMFNSIHLCVLRDASESKKMIKI